jgi:hypothetical protein
MKKLSILLAAAATLSGLLSAGLCLAGELPTEAAASVPGAVGMLDRPLVDQVAMLATWPPSAVTPESVASLLGLAVERWVAYPGSPQASPFGGVRMPGQPLAGYSIAMSYIDAAHSGMDFHIWWVPQIAESRPGAGCLDSVAIQSALVAHHWQQSNFGAEFPEVALPEPRKWVDQLTLDARVVSIEYIASNPEDRHVGCVLALDSAKWFF